MNGIIADLWKGNISPIDDCSKINSETEKILKLIQRHEEALKKMMNEEQKEIFEKYTDCVDEYNCILQEETFCHGFKIGSNMIIEATKKDT